MAENNSAKPEAKTPDFVLPTEQTKQVPAGSAAQGSGAGMVVPQSTAKKEMTSKEIFIGSGIVVVAAILFFLCATALKKNLVQGGRSHSSAVNASLSLFLFLLMLSILVVFGTIGALWTSIMFVAPVGLLVVGSLIFMIISFSGSK